MKQRIVYKCAMYFLLSLMLVSYDSCKEDEKDLWTRKVAVGYGAICSKDLLKFMKPEITYTDKDLQERTLELTDTTWIEKIERTDESESELDSITFEAKLRLVRRPVMPDTVGKTFSFRYDMDAACGVAAVYSTTIYPPQSLDINVSNIVWKCSGLSIEEFLNYAEKNPSKVTMIFSGKNGIKKHTEKGILNFRLEY